MIDRTPPLKIQSLPKAEVILIRLTLMDSIELSKKKEGHFAYLRRVLVKISNLDPKQIGLITFQDAVSLVIYYNMYFWGDSPISTDGNLMPSDFIGSVDEEIDKKSTFVVMGEERYRFSPFILLTDAIKAETQAVTRNDTDNIRFYLFAAGCQKSLSAGVKTIMSLKDSSEDIGLLLAYNDLIGRVSNVTVTLLDDNEENKSGVSVFADKGGERYALPFLRSRFLTFGIR